MSSTSTNPPSTVILWVHPRSCSTMFEQSILQRPKEFRVLHEPMGDAWYFGPERVAPRFSAQDCQQRYPQFSDSTFEKVWTNIVTPQTPNRTFSKDMAQYIFNTTENPVSTTLGPVNDKQDGNPTLIPSHLLLDPSIVHTFLIRTPEKAIPSYYRLCYPGSPTDFNEFDPKESGYKEVLELFKFLKTNSDKEPLILDANDLLEHPKEIMKIWCQHVGVEFDESMLQWNEGTREHFAKWPGWHTSAENSTGVGQGLSDKHITPENHQTNNGSIKRELPDIVKQTIEENKPYYEYLKQFVTKP
ncbi:hypothetical protein OIO90_005567 [Microbotryomycetes sp. JL221]|nr:hypothetical protein OIO90_005567 [Microbotryomycetes sp. JL221]